MFHGVGDDPVIFNPGSVTPRKANVVSVLHAVAPPTKASAVNVLHEATPAAVVPNIPPLLDTGPSASAPPPATNYMPYYIAGGIVLAGGLFFFMTRKH
jgi:hypothetical protein